MSRNKIKYLFVIILGFMFLMPKIVNAKRNKKEKPGPAKISASQVANARIDINNLNALESNVGFSDYNLNSNLEGLEFPRGSGDNAVFEAGFLWGGFVPGDPQVRVGGSAYITGLQPGPILANGQPADPTDPRWSIYTSRPDVYPGGPSVDLSGEVKAYAEGGQSVTQASLRAQYEYDWTNWPAAGTSNDLGAPFEDKNNDGKYEPNIDIPGVPGADQTVYFVANDEDPTNTIGLYGTKPLGIELHVTYWAYNQQGALGDMYFKKWDIINKGYQKYNIDSMFVSFWTDVDLGYAGDDLDANDTTLSLQIVYNGNATDAVYAPLPPPADGFDFFQGPTVPGTPTDSAIFIEPPFKFGYIHGKKNLPMTAAYFFINGNANFGDPPQGDPSGSTQFYNFFNGNIGLTGQPFTNPITGKPTKFVFTGDPVTGTGWVDGVQFPPSDRREGMASGPFNLAPGDTQEVVVAEIFAGAIPGVDRLSAISLLKFYDVTAQESYNNFFQIPSPPPPPKITVAQLSNKIVLDWGENLTAVRATEHYNSLGYTFEGYNVYMLPPPNSTSTPKLLATYDKVDGVLKIQDQYFDASSGVVLTHVSEFGNDTGIRRSFVDSTDPFNSNQPLVNGVSYTFAVTAYGYNPNGVPHALENPMSATEVTVVPHMPNPGVRYSYSPGDTITSVHTAGKSDGNAIALVVDPTRLTGDQYKVTFDTTGGTMTWSLTDVTKNEVKLSGQTDQSGDINYAIVDGMQVKVLGPANGIKGDGAGMVEIAYDGKTLTPSEYDASGTPFHGNTVWHSLNNPDAKNRYYVSTGNDGALGSLTRDGGDQISPYNYKIIFTDTTSANPDMGWWAFDGNFVGKVPFQIWKYNTQTNDSVRLIPVLYSGGGGAPGYFKYKNTDPYFGYNCSDWIYAYDDPRGYDDFAKWAKAGNFDSLNTFGVNEYFARMVFCDFTGNGVMPPPGTVVEIVTNKPNTVQDVFTFTAKAPTNSSALAKVDVEKINVFPNPYYGVNSLETSKYARFVTFSHLPAKATIHIFNLAGVMVRTIQHTDGTQFEKWDLNNDSGLPVGSGLYIVYIDMPSIGQTKILKLAIIQEQQYPDHF